MNRHLIKYILGLLLFGTNGIVASFIALPSHDIVLVRSLLGGLLLAILFFLTGNKVSCFKHRKDTLFIILSGTAMAADWLLLFEAYARIGVSLGMIINYCGPVIVILLSAIIFRERITRKTLLALFLALTGTILISWQSASSGLDTVGLLVAILSAFAYAAMVIFNKLSREVTGTENATIQLFSTLVVVTIYVALRYGLQFEIPAGDLFPVLWIGLMNTGIGCYFYFSSLSSLPAQTVAVCGYIEPLSAVFFSMMLLHERMLPLQIVGSILILGGTVLLEVHNTRAQTEPN